jgi:putative holliday junction resolvase
MLTEGRDGASSLRLIALDFGEARIGVAGSDALGLMAHPLETVASSPRPQALARIGTLCRERKATGVVIGLPIRADGVEGTAAAKVRAFAEALRPHLAPETAIDFQDEYRSTVQASENLRAAGKRTKTHRPLIDQAAAVVILQEYLDARQPLLPDGPADSME